MGGTAFNGLKLNDLLIRNAAVLVAEKEVGEGDNGGQGRLQLVRHAGQEQGPRFVTLLQFAVLQRQVQPCLPFCMELNSLGI